MAKSIFNVDSEFLGTITATSIANATGDVVTIDALNVLKRRTYAEILVDLGGNFVTTDTTQTITGEKTFTSENTFIQGSSADRYIRMVETLGQYNGGYIQWEGSTNKMHIGVHSAADADTGNDLKVFTMQRSNGYIGINKVSPTVPLDVVGSIVGSANITGNNLIATLDVSGATGNFDGASINATYTDFEGGIATGGVPRFGGSRLGDSDIQGDSYDIGTSINFIDGTTPQQVNIAIFENNDVMTIRNASGSHIQVMDLDSTNSSAAVWLTDDAESTYANRIGYTNTYGYVHDFGVQNYVADGSDVAQSFFQIMIVADGAPRMPFYWAYNDKTGASNSYDEIMHIDESTGESIWAYDLTVPDEVYGVGWDASLEVPTKNALYDIIDTLSLDTHTHLLAAGATDVTATAAELNLLDLAGLTVGWVLSADTATTASWKAADAAGFVDLTTSQSIGGSKTFTVSSIFSAGMSIGTIIDLNTHTNNFTSTSSAIFADASDRIAFKETVVNSNVESLAFDLASITGNRVVTWQDVTGTIALVGDTPTAHTHLLAAGATDVTATFGELNLLDLAGLTVGWVLSADTATTASWKAPTGGGGAIGGSITDNQIAVGATTADDIEGSANLTYDGNHLLNINGWVGAKDSTPSTHMALMGTSGTAGEYVFGGADAGDTTYTSYIRIGSSALAYWNGTTQYNIHTTNNGGSGSGFDADTVRSFAPATAATINTLVLRDSSGDVYGADIRATTNILTNSGGASGNSLRLGGTGTGTANITYMTWYESNGTTRQGYCGFPANTHSDLRIYSDVSATYIGLDDGGGVDGLRYFSGSEYTVWHSGNDGASSSLDAGKLAGFSISASGNRHGVIPVVGASSGVIEIGRYIDFHATDGDTTDLNVRLDSRADGDGILRMTTTETTDRFQVYNNATDYAEVGANASGGFFIGFTSGTDMTLYSYQNSTFPSTVTSTNFILSSDRRMKENIRDIENQEFDIRWRRFDFTDEHSGEKNRYGVIAQELQETHPEFVTTNESTGLLSVKYTDLLVAKMAEKDTQIEDLTERIERLENLLTIGVN